MRPAPEARAWQPTCSRGEHGSGHSGCWPAASMALPQPLAPFLHGPGVAWLSSSNAQVGNGMGGRIGLVRGACQWGTYRVCTLGWAHQDPMGGIGGMEWTPVLVRSLVPWPSFPHPYDGKRPSGPSVQGTADAFRRGPRRGFITLTRETPSHLLLPVRHRCPVSQTAAGPGAWISGWTDPRGRLETQGGSVSY